MDALFHFAMSFAGGYILMKGMNADFRLRHLFLLSLVAGLIDIDHIISIIPKTMIAHNLLFIIGLPLIFFHIFRLMKKQRMQVFSLVLIVMWIGHLLADMISGMYGVPLFYPLSGGLFLIPPAWNFIEIDHSFVIAPAGIAIGIYFGLIFSIMLISAFIDKMKAKRNR
jgi:hypothetical protein